MADVFKVLGLMRGDIEALGKDVSRLTDEDMEYIAQDFGKYITCAIDFWEVLGDYLEDQEGLLPVWNKGEEPPLLPEKGVNY